jgi:hypothetical protein
VLAAVWWVRAYADRVADAREAEVRALWADDTARRDKVAADAINAAEADRLAAVAHGQEVERDYLAKIAAADAGRDDLERLLRTARYQVRASTSNAHTTARIAESASEARSFEELRRLDDRVAAATADLRVEAGQNADQLDAVLEAIRPQM